MKLMYITKDPAVARIAQNVGVERIFVDLEVIGKAERQRGMNTVQSDHTLEDVSAVRAVLHTTELLVRVNPIYPGSEAEIDEAIRRGADILMLPYFQNAGQVADFLRFVNGRVKTMLLFETPEAVENIDEILALPGIDECFIGLNDLHLGYRNTFMFELLADGTVERIIAKFRAAGIPYGFGGIASLGKGMLPAEKVLGEHVRLGSSSVILSRSFCNVHMMSDYDVISKLFEAEVPKLRTAEAELRKQDEAWLLRNQADVQAIVAGIVEAMG